MGQLTNGCKASCGKTCYDDDEVKQMPNRRGGRKTGSLVGSQSQKNLKPMSSVLDPNKYAAMPISSQHKNGK